MGNGIKYATVYGPPSDIASINISTPPCPTPSPTPCPGDCPIPTPTVQFSSSSYSVDEGSSATVTVRLSQALSTSVAIPISVTRGTAESGDYSVGLNNGSITFASGVTQKTFTVTANHESDCDDETVKFAFGALPAGVGKGSPSKATLRIDDDETCPTPTPTPTPCAAASVACMTPTPTGTPVPVPVPTPDPLLFNASIIYLDSGDWRSIDVANDPYWSVIVQDLAYVNIAVTPSSKMSKYEFNLNVNPEETGFYVAGSADGECLSSLSGETGWFRFTPPSPREPPQVLSSRLQPVKLIRCGRGKVDNPDQSGDTIMTVKARPVSGGSAFTVLTTKPITQARHYRDNNVTYYIRGSNADGIRGVSLKVTKGLPSRIGLFPYARPSHLGQAHTPTPLLLDVANYEGSENAWDDVGSGVTISRVSTSSQADVVIRGFWDTQVGEGEGKKCGDSIACVERGNGHPHLASNRTMWIEDPPHWGHQEDPKEWTTDFDRWADYPHDLQYLPRTLTHEFGHAIGLGQGKSPKDIMGTGNREIGPCSHTGSKQEPCGLSTNDEKAAKALYEGHAPH